RVADMDSGGSRPSGRLRIATHRPPTRVSGGRRGSRPSGRLRIATPSGRGSGVGSGVWQPSFGAAEDRNTVNEAESTDDFQWQPSFGAAEDRNPYRSEEHTSELQSRENL